MKIIFRTTSPAENEYCEPREHHEVEVDGEVLMSQYEGIEPEDVCFGRDLSSPHECRSVIELVIKAMERGEEITLEDEDVIDDD
jgi:hypothetical protein